MLAKLDWLSFTWKSGSDFNPNELQEFLVVFPEINDILHESIIIKDSVGGKVGGASGHGAFYDHVLGFNDFFSLSYNIHPLGGVQANTNMGVNISIPAHGLEYFFKHMGYEPEQAIELIQELQNRGCKFSRMDIAFDDFEKVFKPYNYIEWYMKDMMVTSFRKVKFVTSQHKKGDTFYCGSRENGKLLRIYDKDFESKGAIPAIRYEFELHSKFTANLVTYMIDNGRLPSFREFMELFIKKIVCTCIGENRSQGVVLPEWQDFMNTASKPSLTHTFTLRASKASECSNKHIRTFRWYSQQVFKGLAAFCHILGSDEVLNMIESCKDSAYNEQALYYWHTHEAELESIILDRKWRDNIFKVS